MRVLLLHPFSLESPSGAWVRNASQALTSAGHDVHTLAVSSKPPSEHAAGLTLVTCRQNDAAADLPFDVPYFTTCRPAGSSGTFVALSDQQLHDYRDCLRKRLDFQIDRFDPHVIHAQYIWLHGQLALETGVPYVLNAWGPEIVDYPLDPRLSGLADQAAENAGRILAADEPLRAEVSRLFHLAADRTMLTPTHLQALKAAGGVAAPAKISTALVDLYETVYEERFGRRP